MNAQTLKQEALESLQRLPEDAGTEEMMYQLYVLENIKRGQDDIVQGKLTPVEDLLREIKTW